MRVLHGGIDLLIIDRPNKGRFKKKGLTWKRGRNQGLLTVIVSRVLVVLLINGSELAFDTVA
jgi:hypothetical protein